MVRKTRTRQLPNVKMNRKDCPMSPRFLPRSRSLLLSRSVFLLSVFFIVLAFASHGGLSFSLSPKTVMAQPPISIPGLQSLQRKYFKQRRKRKRQKPENTDSDPSRAEQKDAQLAPPPPPVRNPQHLRKLRALKRQEARERRAERRRLRAEKRKARREARRERRRIAAEKRRAAREERRARRRAALEKRRAEQRAAAERKRAERAARIARWKEQAERKRLAEEAARIRAGLNTPKATTGGADLPEKVVKKWKVPAREKVRPRKLLAPEGAQAPAPRSQAVQKAAAGSQPDLGTNAKPEPLPTPAPAPAPALTPAPTPAPLPVPALPPLPPLLPDAPSDKAAVPPLPPLPVRKPRRHPSKIAEPDWTPALVRQAVDQCAMLGINLAPLPPVKKGLCGNPAPVLLGQIETATIRPAATLSCPMAASLQQWFSRSVQPLAQKHFGHKVREIRNISSYVCRNRYGDTKTRISEHAYANALDIAWFELQDGEKISVKNDWDNPDGAKAAFLRELHASACKLFGTVLGPDANAAHKDHFHLDRAPRKRSNYCR